MANDQHFTVTIVVEARDLGRVVSCAVPGTKPHIDMQRTRRSRKDNGEQILVAFCATPRTKEDIADEFVQHGFSSHTHHAQIAKSRDDGLIKQNDQGLSVTVPVEQRKQKKRK